MAVNHQRDSQSTEKFAKFDKKFFFCSLLSMRRFHFLRQENRNLGGILWTTACMSSANFGTFRLCRSKTRSNGGLGKESSVLRISPFYRNLFH